MSIIMPYLNQTAVLKVYSGTNEYAENSHTAKTIRCRIDDTNKLVRTSEGQEVVSSAVVYTNEVITVKDLVNDRIVLSVKKQVMLDGSVSHYEAWLL